MKTSSLSFLLLAIFLTFACSKGKNQSQTINLDDAGEAFVQKDELRTSRTQSIRDEKFREVLSSQNKLSVKIEAAAIYFKSFEYQLVSAAEEKSNPGITLMLKQEAAIELTNQVNDLFRDIKPSRISPLRQGLGNNDEMSFYALAAAMHMKDQDQSDSFYVLIKKALKKKSSELAPHEDILLEGANKEMILELIKARVDILAAIALKDMTDKSKMNFFQRLEDVLFRASLGHLGDIDYPSTINEANNSTKSNINKALESAVKTKEFLKSIGVTKELEKNIKRVFTNMKLTPVDEKSIDLQLEATKRYVEELLK